jgi:cellulose synthase/poly-beta-1,6-N-acetylglucosamine synthase-like glycosyltransferase
MPAEAEHPSTSVIICCYTMQRWSHLAEAVAEVDRQARGAAQILVCVDHNDAMLQKARAELPQARVIENTHDRGLSGARNCAVNHASGEVLVFLDDDAVPTPGWLRAVLAPFTRPSVAAVGGAASPAWPSLRPGWFPREFDWVVGCTYLGLPTAQAPVRNVMGCNMAFRRDVFEGGLRFSTSIGRTGDDLAGCEETELCIQLRQLWPEWEVVFEPRAVVRHVVPPSRCSWTYFAKRCYAEGRSKARVSALVGPQDALSSEWDYTTRTLPRGLARALSDAVSGELHGLGRSAAIIAGLGLTSAGYARGRYVG